MIGRLDGYGGANGGDPWVPRTQPEVGLPAMAASRDAGSAVLDGEGLARDADHLDHARRRRVDVAIGHARLRAGDDAGARAAFRRAADSARLAGDGRDLALAAIGHGAATGLTGVVDEAGVLLLEEALALLPGAEAALRCHVMAVLSTRLYFERDRERSVRLAHRALATARAIGDPLAVGSSLASLHYAYWTPAHLDARRAIAADLVDLGERTAEPRLELEGRRWRIVDALEAGDVAAVDAELPLYARRADAAGVARHRARAALLGAMRATLDGRLADAEWLAERSLGDRAPDERGVAALLHAVQLYAIRREQGRLAELEPEVTALVARHPTLPLWRAGLALLHLEAGRPAVARRVLERSPAAAVHELPRDASWLPFLAIAAEVASGTGDVERAATLYSDLLPYADRMAVIGGGAACWGSIQRPLGLLAATLGRDADAESHLTAALAAHARAGAVVLEAHSRVDLSRLLLRRRGSAAARRAAALVAAARRVAADAGASRVASRIARLEDACDAPAARL